MSLEILGIGTALPMHFIAQSETASFAKSFCCRTEQEAKLLDTLYKRTTIQKRGSVLLEPGNGEGPRQTFFPSVRNDSDQGPTTEERMKRYAEEAAPLAFLAANQA